MQVSTFMSAIVIPSRAVGEVVDVKKSSYKKLSKFLRAMESEALVTVKSGGRNPDLVTSIASSTHPALQDHVLSATVTEAEAEEAARSDRRSKAEEARAKAESGPFVRSLLSSTKRANTLFTALSLPMGDPLPPNGISNAIREYVRSEGLDDGRSFRLDDTLRSALTSKSVSKHVGDDGESVLKSAIIPMLKDANALKEVTLLSPPYGEPALIKGPPPVMTATVATRGGNRRKATTVLANLEIFQLDPTSLASELATALAVSTSTRPPAAGKGGDDIVIQGDKASALLAHLSSVYSIPSSSIVINDKRKSKSKSKSKGGGKRK